MQLLSGLITMDDRVANLEQRVGHTEQKMEHVYGDIQDLPEDMNLNLIG